MARTQMVIHTRPPTSVSNPATVVPFAPNVFDTVNGMYLQISGRVGLTFRNSHATVAKTVTITGQPDALGRPLTLGPISIPAGEYLVLPEFQREGWADPASATGDQLYVVGDDSLEYLAEQRALGT